MLTHHKTAHHKTMHDRPTHHSFEENYVTETSRRVDTSSVAALDARAEPFEITPTMVAANLSFGGNQVMQLPGEMMSAVERIWLDANFTWPTTISITRITLDVTPAPGAEPPQEVWSRVSIMGTGWSPDSPVSLKWNNAFGFPGASIALPDAQPGATGFFGTEVILKTVPRRAADFVWEQNNQLVLVAQQRAESGQIMHEADQRAIPPHVVWQWIK